MIRKDLVKEIENSIKNNWNLPAFSNYKGKTVTYGEAAEKILLIHKILQRNEIKKGDKIALVGKNSNNWAIVYLAVITYGAVIVPILHEFHSDSIQHIINHSDTKFLFISPDIYDRIDETKLPDIYAAFSLKDFSLLHENLPNLQEVIKKIKNYFREKFENNIKAEKLFFQIPEKDHPAAIVYTSGTTGFSKGVILTHNNLMANVYVSQLYMPINPGERILSVLPMSHCFGAMADFIYPVTCGCHITFLTKVPSPKIVLKAFKEVKPVFISLVPLIIEKIYKKHLKPFLEKFSTKMLFALPFARRILKNKLREKLMDVFGGNFREILIGGSALNKEVEKFLMKVDFPFTIGYGMTECGPFIAYTGWKEHRYLTTGKIIETLEIKIDSELPEKIPGEILIRGENVMAGYYKDKDATDSALDNKKWLHTGDLGLLDKDGYVYIKGRSKNMILGPSGQNIYPEEIEGVLTNLPYVQEALVLEDNGGLTALVYPDYDLVDEGEISEEELLSKFEEIRLEANNNLPAYSRISKMVLHPEEFEKTPTKKIKRNLYKVK